MELPLKSLQKFPLVLNATARMLNGMGPRLVFRGNMVEHSSKIGEGATVPKQGHIHNFLKVGSGGIMVGFCQLMKFVVFPVIPSLISPFYT